MRTAWLLLGLTLAAQPAQAPAPRVYVSSAAAALVAEGLAQAAPADTTGFQEVPAPSLRNAQNTTSYAQESNEPYRKQPT